MAPWAVLGALGGVRFWGAMAARPNWVRRPWVGALLLGLPVSVAAVCFGSKIPGPGWIVPTLAVLAPVAAAALWYALAQKQYLRGLGLACLIMVGVHWGTYAYRTAYWDRYRDDSQFIEATRAAVAPPERILVMDDDAPLNASWLLYYLDGRATLLHNLTFLKADNISEKEVYLITRQKQEAKLRQYGTFQTVLQSKHSRYEEGPGDRYTLYRLRFIPISSARRGPCRSLRCKLRDERRARCCTKEPRT